MVREWDPRTAPSVEIEAVLNSLNAAQDGDGLLGTANMLLLGDIGVLEIIVDPAARRKAVGHELLAAVAQRAYAEGFTSVGVEVIGDTPSVKFYEHYEFQCAFVEIRNVLPLSTVDWLRLGELARGIAPGYRIE